MGVEPGTSPATLAVDDGAAALPRITGVACLMPSMTERTSMAKVASQPSAGMVSIGLGSPGRPALLNIRSSRPQVVSASATAASISASRVTSQWM